MIVIENKGAAHRNIILNDIQIGLEYWCCNALIRETTTGVYTPDLYFVTLLLSMHVLSKEANDFFRTG